MFLPMAAGFAHFLILKANVFGIRFVWQMKQPMYCMADETGHCMADEAGQSKADETAYQ